MPDRLLAALREAVQEIAETMLFMEIVPSGQGEGPCPLESVFGSAIVGFSGGIEGSLRLAGPLPSILKLAGALAGEEREALDPELEDAFSELANMVAGGVQTRLETTLGSIAITPPVFISGEGHQVESKPGFTRVFQSFQLDENPLFAEVLFPRDFSNRLADGSD
ncbi:MAG: chemotaxis protein CheX [Magnetococcales bacterium]|nr:chemotaxis protein CheX [Magnetococcales bacterium]